MFYMHWNSLPLLSILYSFNNLLNTYRSAELSFTLDILFFSVKIIKVTFHSPVSNKLLFQQLLMQKKKKEKYYDFYLSCIVVPYLHYIELSYIFTLH